MEAAILQNLVNLILPNPEGAKSVFGTDTAVISDGQENAGIKFLSTLLSVTEKQGFQIAGQAPFGLCPSECEMPEDLKMLLTLMDQKGHFLDGFGIFDNTVHEHPGVGENVDMKNAPEMIHQLFQRLDSEPNLKEDIFNVLEPLRKFVATPEKEESEILLHSDRDTAGLKRFELEKGIFPEIKKSERAEFESTLLKYLLEHPDAIENIIKKNVLLKTDAFVSNPEPNIFTDTQVNAETKEAVTRLMSLAHFSKNETVDLMDVDRIQVGGKGTSFTEKRQGPSVNNPLDLKPASKDALADLSGRSPELKGIPGTQVNGGTGEGNPKAMSMPDVSPGASLQLTGKGAANALKENQGPDTNDTNKTDPGETRALNQPKIVGSEHGRAVKIQGIPDNRSEQFTAGIDSRIVNAGAHATDSTRLDGKWGVKAGKSEQGAEGLSRSEIQSQEAQDLKQTAGTPKTGLALKNHRAEPDIAVKVQMAEQSNRKSFSQKTELHQIQEAKGSDSEKNATGSTENGNGREFRFPAIDPDSFQQSLRNRNPALKRALSDLKMDGKPIIKADPGTGEETTLSANHQHSDRNISALVHSKDVQHPEKAFQPMVMKQVSEKAIQGLKEGQTSIKLSLRPDVLGHLKMQISTENSQVSIRIITALPMVKEIIESNLPQLRADFQSQGLELEKCDVSVGQGSAQQHGAFGKSAFSEKFGGIMDETSEDDASDEHHEPNPHAARQGASNGIDYFA